MTTETHAQARDIEFAMYVEQIAEGIRLPEGFLPVTFRDLVVDSVVTVYEAFATPDPAAVQQALKGISI